MNAFEKLLSRSGLIRETQHLSPVYAGHNNLLFDSSGGVITIIKVMGALRRFEGVERNQKLDEFERYLATWNSRQGYYLTFIHEHSEQGLEQQIKRSHQPMLATMNRLQMPTASHLLDSREKYLAGKLHHESLYIVLHTTTGVLTPKERNSKKIEKVGIAHGQQAPNFKKLHDLHSMYVSQVSSALKHLSIQGSQLDARDGAALIGEMWSRRPLSGESIRLIGDHLNHAVNETGYRKTKDGYSPKLVLKDFIYTPLSMQLFQEKVYYPSDRDDYFLCNGYYHSALRMTQSPGSGSVRKYNDLRSRLSPDTNYRFSIQLSSGSNPSHALAAKRIIAILTGNTDTAKSIDELNNISEGGVVCTGVKISCATWAKDIATLERNIDKISGAFQFWGGSTGGGARLAVLTDQPDIGVAKTLPGSIQSGPTTFLPVGIISEILPIEIASSPWQQGLIMRSGEDQAYPIDPADDSLVDFHVYVLIGGTGKGKSVTMTELIKACLFRTGQENLPYLRYLDIGYTSKALFTYFRYMLPENKRHLIVHYTIQNSSEFCLNAFDTPVGMREPPAKELSFLKDTIGHHLAGTTGAEGMASATLVSLGNQLVDEAYRLTSDGNSMCKTYYHPDDNPSLVAVIEKYGLEPVSGATYWYDVTDKLFQLGETRMAAVAQRYAVPTINDLLTVMSKSTAIQESFEGKVVDGTEILDYARTILQSMIQRYPALSGITQLDIEEARMVGFDLQDVAQGAEETGLFYMMFQNILSRGFMSDVDEVGRMSMPEQYRGHHRKRISELRASQRLFAFDELHRLSMGLDPTAPPPKAMALLMRWIKEVRKYSIKLLLSTQSIDHMPPEIKAEGMWSLFFCMGIDTIPGQKRLADLFDISEYGQSTLKRLNGPEAGTGARCLFLAHSKHGKIEQELFITTSPFELWAAPTKAVNLEMMKQALEHLGDPILTARALTAIFPKGSAESEVDRLQLHEGLTETEAKNKLAEKAIHRAEQIRLEESALH